MQAVHLPFRATAKFSALFLDYVEQNERLKPYYRHFPTVENFGNQLIEKKFPEHHRSILHSVLKKQYSTHTSLPVAVCTNIDALLSPTTFTVTTGHQLCLATGPLYFLYKIMTAIATCEELKKKYPQHVFVPVYWMASEDHDIEEINHFHLFGEKYVWDTRQTGAVGRMNTDGIDELLRNIAHAPDWLRNCYTQSQTLAEATRKVVTHLFGEQGLVVVDGDDRELKSLFKPIVKDDLLDSKISGFVTQQSEKLEQLDYKAQVHVREHNCFYLEGNIRERIVQQGTNYEVLNTDIRFTKEELTNCIDAYPERFSPNVILRPLYQESILPNLAYIGGPGELAYWFQLKSMFDAYQMPFPILLPRHFALYVPAQQANKWHKSGLPITDLFSTESYLKASLLEKLGDPLQSWENEKNELEMYIQHIRTKAEQIDKTLGNFAEAELVSARKALTTIEKKVRKAHEERHQIVLNQLLGIKNKLFPGGDLQERHENFLNFITHMPSIVSEWNAFVQPFNLKFTIVVEE